MILLLRNNYISYGAWFVFGSVDSHKTFSNKLNSNWTMIFLFTIFLTYTYTDTFDHYAQNLLKIFPFFAYWYMCTIASSSSSSWKIIHRKFYTKYSSATTLEHNDIFAVHKYRYIHVYKNRPGNKKREAVAQKLSNVRMYGICASVCDLNFDLFLLCFIFI